MELAGMEMTEVKPAGMNPAAMESVGMEPASMMHAVLWASACAMRAQSDSVHPSGRVARTGRSANDRSV